MFVYKSLITDTLLAPFFMSIFMISLWMDGFTMVKLMIHGQCSGHIYAKKKYHNLVNCDRPGRLRLMWQVSENCMLFFVEYAFKIW